MTQTEHLPQNTNGHATPTKTRPVNWPVVALAGVMALVSVLGVIKVLPPLFAGLAFSTIVVSNLIRDEGHGRTYEVYMGVMMTVCAFLGISGKLEGAPQHLHLLLSAAPATAFGLIRWIQHGRQMQRNP